MSATPSPLLREWSGPQGGVPPFDAVDPAGFPEAAAQAIAAFREDLARLVAQPEPPTFDNTLGALERAGRAFQRFDALYGTWSVCCSSPAFQEVERELSPLLAAFAEEVNQNEALFARLERLVQSDEKARWNPEQQRLAHVVYTRFVRSGARLSAPAKKRVGEISERLASLYTQFSQNVLADEERDAVVLSTEAELAGLPASVRAAAAAAATERGLPGKWAVPNTRSAMEPFLTYSARRDLRERVWKSYAQRGDHEGGNYNPPLISEILKLRAERARLLGFPTHAHWRLESTMARTPERAMALLTGMWGPAVKRAREEVAAMQALADEEGAGLKIEPWDYRYYQEKVRKAQYDFDQGAVKPYLSLENLRAGMFWVAGELFGLDFTQVEGLPVYHPEVRVFEVRARASSRPLGLLYLDPYARAGKRSGAWMSAYRSQATLDGEVSALVSNNSNFLPPAKGEPVLLGWEDAVTQFHEFGHALHGLLSRVTYPTLSGTSVATDYVEFPSQLLEHWLWTPEVLGRFARHWQSGEPIPPALVERISAAATFSQGFATVEYLGSALVDLKLHLAPADELDVAAFEEQTLAELGMPREVGMRHRPPHFSHVFADEMYSAGYYSYLWADTLVADAFEAFREAGNPFDPGVAGRLLEHVFTAGNKVDPAEAYRAFRGRNPDVAALRRKRGFAR